MTFNGQEKHYLKINIVKNIFQAVEHVAHRGYKMSILGCFQGPTA